jgi:hypothetical protein
VVAPSGALPGSSIGLDEVTAHGIPGFCVRDRRTRDERGVAYRISVQHQYTGIPVGDADFCEDIADKFVSLHLVLHAPHYGGIVALLDSPAAKNCGRVLALPCA